MQLKILVTGPVGAGKTTAIATIADKAPVETDEVATDSIAAIKKRTTVALDFGVVKLDEDDELHLYGTPGQERFDFMWDILSYGALGVLIMVDCTMPDAPKELQKFVRHFRSLIQRTGLVVGLSHTDLLPGLDIDVYHDALAAEDVRAPVLSLNAHSSQDVALALESLVATINPEIVS
ncbi:MAG: ATP/GTP-binding protein [Nocardioides sp.]|nr:ATP/GTP-binding protein [Nocardioides sp.]